MDQTIESALDKLPLTIDGYTLQLVRTETAWIARYEKFRLMRHKVMGKSLAEVLSLMEAELKV